MRFLDYVKVKDGERQKATELFGTAEEPTELASKVRHLVFFLVFSFFLFAPHETLYTNLRADKLTATQIMGVKSRTFDLGAGGAATANGAAGQAQPSRLSRIKLTDKEKKRLQEMIKKADSLQEIIRLEKMLNEGTIPQGVHLDADAMEE